MKHSAVFAAGLLPYLLDERGFLRQKNWKTKEYPFRLHPCMTEMSGSASLFEALFIINNFRLLVNR